MYLIELNGLLKKMNLVSQPGLFLYHGAVFLGFFATFSFNSILAHKQDVHTSLLLLPSFKTRRKKHVTSKNSIYNTTLNFDTITLYSFFVFFFAENRITKPFSFYIKYDWMWIAHINSNVWYEIITISALVYSCKRRSKKKHFVETFIRFCLLVTTNRHWMRKKKRANGSKGPIVDVEISLVAISVLHWKINGNIAPETKQEKKPKQNASHEWDPINIEDIKKNRIFAKDLHYYLCSKWEKRQKKMH